MNYTFTSLKQVLDILQYGEELSAGKISERLGKSRAITHKYLKALVEDGKIKKIGTAPHTKYRLKQILGAIDQTIDPEKKVKSELDYKSMKLGEEVFLKFSPRGNILRGIEGMQLWSKERGLVFETVLKQYIQMYTYIEGQQDECGMLHAEESFGKHFQHRYLDSVVFADQYIYGQFGRGKLAEISYYAKQSQNKNLIEESIATIFPKLKCIISRGGFDAIAMTPWSVRREEQILEALKKKLSSLGLPFINVIKYSPSNIFIPQKSLKKTEDRIENARSTIFVDDKNSKNYKKVLLIDDFVGSGATLNETAKKLKDEGVELVTGFAFVGNTNLSYDIINEI